MTTIDCTPTWQGILPYLLVILQAGNAEGKKTAKAELLRMAKLADTYVADQKDNKELKVGGHLDMNESITSVIPSEQPAVTKTQTGQLGASVGHSAGKGGVIRRLTAEDREQQRVNLLARQGERY